jgi:hypothetical protein
VVLAGVVSLAKIAGRRDDRNTLRGIEVKEVDIAGDNETGFAVDSKFKEFVVAGIAARADCVNYWNCLSDAIEQTQKILAFSNGHVGIELGAREDVGQFLQSGFGDEKLGFINGFVDSLTGDGGRQEKTAPLPRLCRQSRSAWMTGSTWRSFHHFSSSPDGVE